MSNVKIMAKLFKTEKLEYNCDFAILINKPKN